MDLNRMTERMQEALFSAQSLAVSNEHQEVDEDHLFLALLKQDESLVAAILERIQFPSAKFEQKINELLHKNLKYLEVG